MDPDNIVWHKYFSYWIFIWFVLYLGGIITYNPFPIYLLVLIYIIIKIIYLFLILYVLPKKKTIQKFLEKKIEKKIIIICVILILIIDILPLFFLKPEFKKIDFLFGSVIFLIYLMYINYLQINFFSHYFRVLEFKQNVLEKYTPSEFIHQVIYGKQ